MSLYQGRRLFLPVTAFVLCVCQLAGCSSPEAPRTPAVRSTAGTPVTGDSLVEGTIGEASTLIPILASDSSSHAVAGQIYNGLIKYDKNLNIVPDLAESFDISRDGLTITFHLRRGVRWHDGAPFTARDVLYTYRVTIDPKTPTAYAEDFKQVKRISAPDDYTVRVVYGVPFAPALASWGMNILPAHLLEGQDITREPAGSPAGRNRSLSFQGVGSRPENRAGGQFRLF